MTDAPTAFITGISGQDGSYLTELLLSKGYVVHGIVRRASLVDRPRLDHLTADHDIYGSRLFLHYGDLDDVTTLRRLLRRIQPDEFYHLAGQSHVGLSFEIPESTCDFTAMGTLRILEIIRDLEKPPRFLNTGSSEIFGAPKHAPQNEQSPVDPATPYGVAKAFAVQMTRVYRDSFGLFCCNAICYNHESPRRGPSFVTRKITQAAARISLGEPERLTLGNLDGARDWGYAPEYVEAMWRMLQVDAPEDLVIATGTSTTVRQFLEYAFGCVNLDWREHVACDERFLRPADAKLLVGDPARAKATIGWEAQTGAAELAEIMVRADIAALRHQTAG
ncbi:GDP-mannose 4,6-dehydratase [Sphingomonas oligophenolica]|uniref:GDP-mannose 4,6-dehydratase n=1 Tax=Sphingomonas oligophenolica TaxID=301154 RepID=A0ABU9YBZ0_9SPHN